MRIIDWSSDVCSSYLGPLRQRLAVSLPGPRSEARAFEQARPQEAGNEIIGIGPERTRDRLQGRIDVASRAAHGGELHQDLQRSEERREGKERGYRGSLGGGRIIKKKNNIHKKS